MGFSAASFVKKRGGTTILMLLLALSLTACNKKPEEVPEEDIAAAVIIEAEAVVETSNTEEAVPTVADSNSPVQEPENDSHVINIDPDMVEVSNVSPFPFTNHPNKSREVVKVLRYPGESLGYNNDIKWTYAASFPRFEDLKAPGAVTIREYYTAKYEAAKLEADALRFDDTIYDFASSNHYSHLDWDSHTVGDYLVVGWGEIGYGGGAHGWHHYYTEQFDMNTGKLLTKEDVFVDFETAAPVLSHLVTKHLVDDCGWTGYYKGSNNDEYTYEQFSADGNSDLDFLDGKLPFSFRLEETGIVFIFNEYDIDCYAAGAFFALVPYEELHDVLKPDFRGIR